jgi:DNA-binding HxlR family transcriptional regulator
VLRRSYDNQICSVAWALELVGERWTLLIVRDALLGISRFSDFRHRLGITASVLAARLDRLVSAGIIEQVPYQQHPVRYDYHLTPCGRELAMVVLSLMRWGDQHLAGEAGPPRTAHHESCGGEVEPRLVCQDCAAEVDPDEVVTMPGARGAAPAHRPGG